MRRVSNTGPIPRHISPSAIFPFQFGQGEMSAVSKNGRRECPSGKCPREEKIYPFGVMRRVSRPGRGAPDDVSRRQWQQLMTKTIHHWPRSIRPETSLRSASTVDMTLPAFVAERRAAALGARRSPLSIDISCPDGAQQQTRLTPPPRSNGGTDGQTDRWTPGRYVDPATYTMRAVQCP